MPAKNRVCARARQTSEEGTRGERLNLLSSTTTVTGSNQANAQMNWYLFLFIVMLGAIAVSLVLIMLSKNPKDLRHTSLVRDEKPQGKLRTLAESIKVLPQSYDGYSPVRALMRRILYEKIKALRGIPDEDLNKLYQNDAAMLQKYVKDPVLIRWLTEEFPRATQSVLGSFRKERGEKKQKYQMELTSILEKMEKWGS